MARWNGKPHNTADKFEFILDKKDKQNAETSAKKGPFRQMMADRTTRHNLLASMVLWIMSSFNFYLVTFYLKYFPGNIFQSTLCFAFSDLFGYIFSGLLLK